MSIPHTDPGPSAGQPTVATQVQRHMETLTPRHLRLRWLPWLWLLAMLLGLVGLWLARL